MKLTAHPQNFYLDNVGGQLDQFFEATVEVAWEGAGSWELKMPADDPRAGDLLEHAAGIRFDLDGEYLSSGPVRWLRLEKPEDGPTQLAIGGPDESGFLYERRADPCPAVYYTPVYEMSNGTSNSVAYLDAEYDEQNDYAEAVLKHYVDLALGPSAAAFRQLAHFDIAPDLHRGPAVAVQARFQMLPDVLRDAARIGNGRYSIGWGIKQIDKRRVFDVQLPRVDSSMVFSVTDGTLKKFSFERTAPKANNVLLGAEGEGVDRTFWYGDSFASRQEWGLIEGELLDRGDTADFDQLLAITDDELGKSAEHIGIELVAAETDGRRYRRDWDVGDIGTVTFAGLTFNELIRSVTLKWSPDQPVQITPFIGTPDVLPPNVLGVVAGQRDLARRASQLERR